MYEWDRERLERALRAAGVRVGLPLELLHTTASTNDDAKQAARAGAPSGAGFVADTQLQGRGRLGRAWYSPPGTNLYASFVLRPAVGGAAVSLVPLAAGLAVADAIAPLVGSERVTIKWPNDVLVGGRKVAGVLSETEVDDRGPRFFIVGIGVNVAVTDFPDELSAIATSLALEGAHAVDRDELFVRLCVALGHRVAALETGVTEDLVSDLARRDALLGKPVDIDGAKGVAMGIQPDGRLRVVGEDGRERAIGSGEVSLGHGPSLAVGRGPGSARGVPPSRSGGQ